MAVITTVCMNKELIGIKKNKDYSLYSSPLVITHKKAIIEVVNNTHDKFKELFKTSDSTWLYDKYNIFTLTAGSDYFYCIYQQIAAAVRDRIGDSRPLWMEAWLNFHMEDEVLDWHFHDVNYIAHGYLSIDPKNTVTEFEQFTIENKVGNLYIGKTGPGFNHAVRVRERYDGVRITIAFNVIDKSFSHQNNLSHIPI